MKEIIKALIPPLFFNIIKKLYYLKYGWTGDYLTWQDALEKSTGYDNNTILKKVMDASLKVKNGEKIYERDGVTFDRIQYSLPLITGLLYGISLNEGKLNICDFGGSLGSSYRQNLKLLKGCNSINWGVVEQENFVKNGKEFFSDENLDFYFTIGEYLKINKPDILLLSSVIQYLEETYEFIEKIIEYDFKIIIIDLTPFSKNDDTIITVQSVNPNIYSASYPCRILSLSKIKSLFAHKYTLLEEFDTTPQVKIPLSKNREAIYKGLIFLKNDR